MKHIASNENMEVIDSFESWLERQPVKSVKARAGFAAEATTR